MNRLLETLEHTLQMKIHKKKDQKQNSETRSQRRDQNDKGYGRFGTRGRGPMSHTIG